MKNTDAAKQRGIDRTLAALAAKAPDKLADVKQAFEAVRSSPTTKHKIDLIVAQHKLWEEAPEESAAVRATAHIYEMASAQILEEASEMRVLVGEPASTANGRSDLQLS